MRALRFRLGPAVKGNPMTRFASLLARARHLGLLAGVIAMMGCRMKDPGRDIMYRPEASVRASYQIEVRNIADAPVLFQVDGHTPVLVANWRLITIGRGPHTFKLKPAPPADRPLAPDAVPAADWMQTTFNIECPGAMHLRDPRLTRIASDDAVFEWIKKDWGMVWLTPADPTSRMYELKLTPDSSGATVTFDDYPPVRVAPMMLLSIMVPEGTHRIRAEAWTVLFDKPEVYTTTYTARGAAKIIVHKKGCAKDNSPEGILCQEGSPQVPHFGGSHAQPEVR